MFSNTYSGRRVLITGHTGFKGSWLSSWLMQLGAEVGGLSNGVPSCPSNFEVLELERRLKHYVGDVRSADCVAAVVEDFKPEIVFHLAAQALVRRSYLDPVGTFGTNAIGSLNVLECVRHTPGVRALVMITSDKCYRNVEWVWGYRENDILGGDDPYSSSKACAEVIAYSYIKSYFAPNDGLAAVATAEGRQCNRRRRLGGGSHRAGLCAQLVEWCDGPNSKPSCNPAMAACNGAAERVPSTWLRTLGTEISRGGAIIQFRPGQRGQSSCQSPGRRAGQISGRREVGVRGAGDRPPQRGNSPLSFAATRPLPI